MKKKQARYRSPVLIALFPLIVMGIGLLLCNSSRGFNPKKISSALTYDEAWGVPPLNQEEVDRLIKNVFSQSFYYLGSGRQCYAFQSEDGQFVLKFFKMHELLPKDWLNEFPFSLLENYRFNNVEKRRRLFYEVFSSIKASYDHLREETGLLFIHLNKTRNLKTKVTLLDKEGKKRLVDLDSKEFFLQKKATKVYPHLMELMQKGEEELVHRCIRSLFRVVATRCERGFTDLDIGVRNNYGFVGNEAIIIDCGSLVPDDIIAQPHHYQREILRIAEAMDHWAHNHYEELAPIIQDEVHRIISAILVHDD